MLRFGVANRRKKNIYQRATPNNCFYIYMREWHTRLNVANISVKRRFLIFTLWLPPPNQRKSNPILYIHFAHHGINQVMLSVTLMPMNHMKRATGSHHPHSILPLNPIDLFRYYRIAFILSDLSNVNLPLASSFMNQNYSRLVIKGNFTGPHSSFDRVEKKSTLALALRTLELFHVNI